MLDIKVVDAEIVRPVSLIGVSGYMGSGKDTVGEIIKYLTSPEAIRKGSFSKCEEMGYVYDTKWSIEKFAAKLKLVAQILTGVPAYKFEDRNFKESEMPSEWNSLEQSGRYKTSKPMTYRTLLQKLGTEAMRNGLHTNVWVNALFADYKPTQMVSSFPPPATEEEYIAQQGYPKWCITDMRFPNEFDAVKKRGGITIYVHRPDTHSLQSMIGVHESETALDNHQFDYAILNHGGIEDLVKVVREILINERII
jgi:hypothetical protein